MISLYINYYRDKDPDRQAEIDHCLSSNLNWADRVVAVCLSGIHVPSHPKLVVANMEDRPTYADMFEIITRMTGPDDINIIANSDVACSTDKEVFEQIHDKTVWALTRHEPQPGGEWAVWERTDSQDVWVWRGYMPQIFGADFPMGVPGCDNRIAYLFESAGYMVENPSRDVVWRHHHKGSAHNYTQNDRVEPPYKFLYPCGLNWIEKLPTIQKNNADSQYEEAEIIDYIFENIGPEWKRFADIGAGTYEGNMSNTRHLVTKGWKGVGFDCNPCDDAWIVKKFITPQNIVPNLEAYAGSFVQIDLLCLDIDSCDFWVLKKVLESRFKPRVIVTEFNSGLPCDQSLVLKYEKGYKWNKTDKFGYSFLAGKKLLEKHGYSVIMNHRGVNIIALRNDLVNAFIPEIEATQIVSHPNDPTAQYIKY